jgi:hypothetical protein
VTQRDAAPRPRLRVTIDLRGIGPRLQEHAAVHRTTTASIVRAAVVSLLDAEGGVHELDRVVDPIDARSVKMTVRMPASHAVLLALRARRVGLSQGIYLSSLLDGRPPIARATDHGTAVATLADSTQKVAAMSSDVRALVRLLSHGDTDEAASYRETLDSLSQDIRRHLEIASQVVAGLTLRGRSSASASHSSRRRGHST